jgi:type III pantothenate kinase
MLIAVDIGNSSINIGYFINGLLLFQKIETHPLRHATEYAAMLQNFLLQNHVEKRRLSGIISSVVLSHTAVFRDALNGLSDAGKIDLLTVDYRMNSGLTLAINNPEEMGTDRIAGAVGACGLYKPPVAIIDCGTATTLTVVDQDARCIGGAIMPGLGLMNETLDKGTYALRRIAVEAPVSALGKDTSGCIRSGLFYGTAGAVERILSEIEEETQCEFKVVITGGYGHLIANFIKRPCEVNPRLTLEGLRILYEKNRPS